MKTDDARKVLERALDTRKVLLRSSSPLHNRAARDLRDLATYLRAALEDVERVEWLETVRASVDTSDECSGRVWDLEWDGGWEEPSVAGGHTLRDAIDAARAKPEEES